MGNKATRQAVNALLDMLVAVDEDSTEALNERAVQTAFQRLSEIDAVSATFDDETDLVTLEITPLLTAIGVTIDTLLRQLASERGLDRLAVLNTLREHLSGVFDGDD